MGLHGLFNFQRDLIKHIVELVGVLRAADHQQGQVAVVGLVLQVEAAGVLGIGLDDERRQL